MKIGMEIIERLTGERPLGWYNRPRLGEYPPPGGRLRRLFYDSDYYGDDLPLWTEVRKSDGTTTPHLVVPYTLDTNDMRFAMPQGFSHGDEFFEYLRDAFDVMYDEGDERPAMMSVGMHCRLLGRPGASARCSAFWTISRNTTVCGSVAASTSPATGSRTIPTTADNTHQRNPPWPATLPAPRFAPPAELPDWAQRSVDLANPRLGAKALYASDDFFAEVGRMLNPEPAQFVPGKFDDNGKWMDGWETRRKRTTGHDWCLVKLGVKGRIRGFDVDTSHFVGNYPPAVSIEACVSDSDEVETLKAAAWTEVLPPPRSARAATIFSSRRATRRGPTCG